jgi:hypothetical protein
MKKDLEFKRKNKQKNNNPKKGEIMRMENEKTFETGMDEQAKQGAMQNLSEKVDTHDKRNDRSADYYETLRLERLLHARKMESLELRERELAQAERQQALKAEQDRDVVRHMSNLKALNHQGKAYEELIEKDAEEAKAISEILSGVQIEAIKSAVAVAVAEVLRSQKA